MTLTRFISLVKFEHTIFALPFAYVGAFLAVDGVPSAHDLIWITVAMIGARSLAMGLNRLIDAGIDGTEPAHGHARASVRPALRASGRDLLPRRARHLPARGLAARPDRSLALADPGRRVRDLPVPEAVHLAVAHLARGGRRARSGRRLGRDHGRASARGVAARSRGRLLGGRLRLLLRAARPRLRPPRGPEVGGDRVRRTGRVLGRARPARRHGRRSWPGPDCCSTSASSTGWASPLSPSCSSTSTRSCGRGTCAGSTRRSSS